MMHYSPGRWVPECSLREALEIAEDFGIKVLESPDSIEDWRNVLPHGGRCRTIGEITWWPALGEWRCYRRQGGTAMDYVTLLLVASRVVEKFGGKSPKPETLDPEWWESFTSSGFTYYQNGICRFLNEEELAAEAGISLEVPDTVESLVIWTEEDELLRRLA